MLELKDFARVPIGPGETKTVRFRLDAAKLSFINRDMKRVVEPGTFRILAGPNSVELIDAVLTVTDK